jgi:hypothetical protein
MSKQTLEDFRDADVFDLRDVIERIEELEAEDLPDVGDVEDEDTRFLVDEMRTLRELMSDVEGMGGDEQWRGAWYPITFVRDSYWMDYAQELAEDIGAIPDANAAWPLYAIDWELAARDLQMDYSSVELDGVTFWTR